MRQTTVHECFKFDAIRFSGYGLIAEKPRVSHLSRFFFVHAVGETMRWIEK